MTPDPGQLPVSSAPAQLSGMPRERMPAWLLWTVGPYMALFGVVFGAALLVMGDATCKVVGACLILPSALAGLFLVVGSSLGMSRKGWSGTAGH